MKQTITNDVANELSQMRAGAAGQGGLRSLEELELGWVAGGDGGPNWDGTPPPTP